MNDSSPLAYLADAADRDFPDLSFVDSDEELRPARLDPITVLRHADEVLNGDIEKATAEDIRRLASDIRDSIAHYGDLEGYCVNKPKVTKQLPLKGDGAGRNDDP